MDQINGLKQGTSLPGKSFHPALRIAAKVVSIVFHPLFIPVYISWFLIYINPLFPAFTAGEKLIYLLRFVIMYSLFPMVTVLLAKGLGFVQSVQLKTQKDRIIPYVACGLYYFWMWYVLHNQLAPQPVLSLSLAIFLASSMGLMANSYLKVSMHAIAVGVLLAFALLLGLSSEVNMGFYISVALFIAGLVCTARLITGDHHPVEIYVGLLIGIVAQVIAYAV